MKKTHLLRFALLTLPLLAAAPARAGVNAAIVPADEAWLHKNKAAKNSVRRGLEQAAAGALNKGPNLASGDELINKIQEQSDVHRKVVR